MEMTMVVGGFNVAADLCTCLCACGVYAAHTGSVALIPGPSAAVCTVVFGGRGCGGAWGLRARAGVRTVARGELHIWQSQIHIYRAEACGSEANINTYRATLVNGKHELSESRTLYVTPLQLHVGINII